MNKAQAKQYIKEWGLYGALLEISENEHKDNENLIEIFEDILFEIGEETIERAIEKGTR